MEQYKDLKLILNIRNITHWFKSKYLFSPSPRAHGNDTDIDILNTMKMEWYQYHCRVIKDFQNKNISNNLLIFDIEHDDINKLITFFNSFNLSLNSETNQLRINKRRWSQRMKWNNLIGKYPQINQSDHDLKSTEIQRILHFCRKKSV